MALTGKQYFICGYNSISLRKIIFVFIVVFLPLSLCSGQKYKRSIRNPERELFGKSLNTKSVKYKEAPSIVRAKKKQLRKQKQLKKDAADYVEEERKRHLKIQSPDVRERIIENRKAANRNYKEKKKELKKESRKRERKNH